MALLSIITLELGGLTAGGAYLGMWVCKTLHWPQEGALVFALLGFSIGMMLVVKMTLKKDKG